MLGFMAVSGILGWMNIRGLSLKVDLPDVFAFDQDETKAKVAPRNPAEGELPEPGRRRHCGRSGGRDAGRIAGR